VKLIIQIPCLNEETSIGQVLSELPREIPGFDQVETLVVDDGSTDKTVEAARAAGVTHVLRLRHNKGLAAAFLAGVEECLRLGADVIVNTDGDNQYKGSDIPRLVAPIVEEKAEFVIGVRDIANIRHFSARKKYLQYLGSWVVRKLSGTRIDDVTSGFRAFSRAAAIKLDLVTDYTHTLETIITLGKERTTIAQVLIATNPKVRNSRLFASMLGYIVRCTADMVRIHMRYEPLRTFGSLGVMFILIGCVDGTFYLADRLIEHSRSTVVLSLFPLFCTSGLLFIIMGFLGDSIACNRRMLSKLTRHLRNQ